MSEIQPIDQKKVNLAVERVGRIFDQLKLTVLEALTTAEIIVHEAENKINEARTVQIKDLQ